MEIVPKLLSESLNEETPHKISNESNTPLNNELVRMLAIQYPLLSY